MSLSSKNDIFSMSFDSIIPPPAPPASPRAISRTPSRRERKHLRELSAPTLPSSTHLAPVHNPLSSSVSKTSSFFAESPQLSPSYASSFSSASTIATSISTYTNPLLHVPLPSFTTITNAINDINVEYDQADLIGSGRSSDVYLGHAYTSADKPPRVCAVKLLHGDPESHALGLREAWMLRHLECDRRFAVQLIGINMSMPPVPKDSVLQRGASRISLLLEYAPYSLHTLAVETSLALTAAAFTSLSRQLSTAVAFIHSRGILHTDIKPQNILLTPNLSTLSSAFPYTAVLADFNTALHIPSLPEPTSTTPIDLLGLGTPAYSPREFNVLFLSSTTTFLPSTLFAADVFSLGVTLTSLLTRREPYARLTKSGRRVEMGTWLRKGWYWRFEESERLEDIPLVDRMDTYADGFPALRFAENERVSEEMMEMLKRMCAPESVDRPDIGEVVRFFGGE